jgi:hypothetical protein
VSITVGTREVVHPWWPPPHQNVYKTFICIHRFAVYMGIKINIKDIEDFELTPEVMEELLTLLDAITRLLEQ